MGPQGLPNWALACQVAGTKVLHSEASGQRPGRVPGVAPRLTRIGAAAVMAVLRMFRHAGWMVRSHTAAHSLSQFSFRSPVPLLHAQRWWSGEGSGYGDDDDDDDKESMRMKR